MSTHATARRLVRFAVCDLTCFPWTLLWPCRLISSAALTTLASRSEHIVPLGEVHGYRKIHAKAHITHSHVDCHQRLDVLNIKPDSVIGEEWGRRWGREGGFPYLFGHDRSLPAKSIHLSHVVYWRTSYLHIHLIWTYITARQMISTSQTKFINHKLIVYHKLIALLCPFEECFICNKEYSFVEQICNIQYRYSKSGGCDKLEWFLSFWSIV